MKAVLLLSLMLCSCTVIKTPDITVAQLGGKGVLDYDATTKKLSHVYNNDISFKRAMAAIQSVAAASIASKEQTLARDLLPPPHATRGST